VESYITQCLVHPIVDVVGVVEVAAINRYLFILEGAGGGIGVMLEKEEEETLAEEEEWTLEREAERILEGEEEVAGLRWKLRFSSKFHSLVFLGCLATNEMGIIGKAMVHAPSQIRRSNESKINPPLK
jgi:hypothetical protein